MKDVVPVIADQLIWPDRDQPVIARTAIKLAKALQHLQQVAALAAVQHARTRAAKEAVIAQATVQAVAARAAVQRVIARRTGQPVIAGKGEDLVVALGAQKGVVGIVAQDGRIVRLLVPAVVQGKGQAQPAKEHQGDGQHGLLPSDMGTRRHDVRGPAALSSAMPPLFNVREGLAALPPGWTGYAGRRDARAQGPRVRG